MGAESMVMVAEEGSAGVEPADRAVVEAIARGDGRGALMLCARQHGAALGRLCMALLGVRGEAEDVTQETLLDAYGGFASFRGEGSLRAWLFAIARRKCARQLERRGKHEARLHLVTSQEAEPGGEEALARKQRAARGRRLLEQLRPSEREAVLLRFEAELSFREIAEVCGIDEAAARKRVSRALARLREASQAEE